MVAQKEVQHVAKRGRQKLVKHHYHNYQYHAFVNQWLSHRTMLGCASLQARTSTNAAQLQHWRRKQQAKKQQEKHG